MLSGGSHYVCGDRVAPETLQYGAIPRPFNEYWCTSEEASHHCSIEPALVAVAIRVREFLSKNSRAGSALPFRHEDEIVDFESTRHFRGMGYDENLASVIRKVEEHVCHLRLPEWFKRFFGLFKSTDHTVD